MSAIVGNQLNKFVGDNMTPAEFAANRAFVGINLDTTGGGIILLDAFELQILPVVADLPNLNFANFQICQFSDCQIFKPV